MTAPDSPNATPPAPSRRPSLMAATPAADSDDDQGFSVSILSAASGVSGGSAAIPRSAAPRTARSPASSRLLWLGGVTVVAVGLMVAAHLREPAPPEPPPAQVTAVLAPVAAPLPPTPVAAASEVVTAEVAASAAPVASADLPASAASASAASNPFDRIAAAAALPPVRATPRTAPASAPARKPATAAPTRTASPAAPRDRDAELVAALMANADAGREIQLPASATAPSPKPAPLSATERNRFAAELRQCQQRNPGNAAARELCRAEACESRGYVGRTKSCPAAATRADRTTSPHGPSA